MEQFPLTIGPDGKLSFGIHFSARDPSENDRAPTTRMIVAMRELFGIDAFHWTFNQIHEAMCARDYARSAIELMFDERSERFRTLMVALLTAAVMNDHKVLDQVIDWSETAFEDGIEISPRDMPSWLEVLDFAFGSEMQLIQADQNVD